jgi:hypothetical protein
MLFVAVAAASLIILLTQGADAFFETEQTRINVSRFGPTLSIVGFGIGTTFASGQIDQGQFPLEFASVDVSKEDLTNGMGSRRSVVGFGCMSCSETNNIK